MNYNEFNDHENGEKLILKDDYLYNDKKDVYYPIINEIPRFVDTDNYANNFGIQWNNFKNTQLDSFTNTKISFDRLSRCLNGHINKIKDKLILEAGSGAGRFTEILLQMGANVHSFDISNSVEANYENNKKYNKLLLAQADINKIPFQKNNYDYVVCLGVIQHTPNPEDSIDRLYEMVKPGGVLIFDHYLFKWRNILPPPIGSANIIYRKLILLLPIKMRFRCVKASVDLFFPVHWFFRNYRFMQRVLRRISPVHFYYLEYNLGSKNTYYNWALLDTHDSTTDFYKHHRSVKEIYKKLENLGASGILIKLGGNGLEAFCVKN
jgi:SAM-dependent methyltransferase